MVSFFDFLWIDVFVWARVVCGVRTYHSGSGNAGPMPRKIHEKDPERHQGDSTHAKNEEFLDLETSPASKMRSGEQNRALTHSIEIFTWLEELASESNTIQAQ